MGFTPGSLAVRWADLESRKDPSGSSGNEAYRDRNSRQLPEAAWDVRLPQAELEVGLRREGRAMTEMWQPSAACTSAPKVRQGFSQHVLGSNSTEM